MEPQTNFENQSLDQKISPNLPSKNIYKILFFVTLGLFLIVSSVLTTLLITKTEPTQDKNTVQIQNEVIPTISEVTSTIIESEIPKDWKTYNDPTYKFSINYPPEWTLETNINDVNRDPNIVDFFTIKSPEGEKEEKRIKSEPPTAEGYQSPCGFYYINCYKSFDLFKTESRVQENTLLSFLKSYDFGGFTQSTTNGHILYSVISNSLGGGKEFYIQNKDTSFCSLQFCWQTSSGKELTPIEKQFVNSFKFN